MSYLQKQKCLTNDNRCCVYVKNFPRLGNFLCKKNCFHPLLRPLLHIFFDKTLDFYVKKHKICINFSPIMVKTINNNRKPRERK